MWSKQQVLDLIPQMTLAEKVGQLNQLGCSIYGILDDSNYTELIKKGAVGSFLTTMGSFNINQLQKFNMENSRLKIPLLFAGDIIHGVKTIFPTPLAESCTWEPSLARKSASVAAKEASALGIRQTYAPMVDIARDARWGRIVEGAGEDTLLGNHFCAERVKGFQGKLVNGKVDEFHLGACAKHFAAYGAPATGKDYDSVELSEYTLDNVYLPPFYTAVKNDVLMFMSAFHTLNGMPCTASSYLLDRVLRKRWKYNGAVVSDYAAVYELQQHRYAQDENDAVTLAIQNGVDIDMVDKLYAQRLEELVQNGAIEQKYLDQSVERVLMLKYRLGLFDAPYCNEEREKTDLFTPPARQLCLEIGKKSMVLLKNENALPQRKGSKVLIVGALATQKENMLGSWAYYDNLDKVTDIVQGLSVVYKADYIPVFDFNNLNELQLQEALSVASNYDRIFFVAGETIQMAGESGSRAILELPPVAVSVAQKLSSVNPKLTLLLVSGRPTALQETEKLFDSIVECWNLGMTMGQAVAENVTGKSNFSGKLTTSFPRVSGQCPICYSHTSTGRPNVAENAYCTRYVDVASTPLYPFGFGLTYSNATLTSATAQVVGKNLVVNATVANNSNTICTETVQVYCAPLFSKPVRPTKQLIGYTKVTVGKQKNACVKIVIALAQLGDIINGKLRKPNGKYDVYVGLSSDAPKCAQIDICAKA